MKRIGLIWFLSIIVMNLNGQVLWIKHPDNPIMVPGTAGEWDEVIICLKDP